MQVTVKKFVGVYVDGEDLKIELVGTVERPKCLTLTVSKKSNAEAEHLYADYFAEKNRTVYETEPQELTFENRGSDGILRMNGGTLEITWPFSSEEQAADWLETIKNFSEEA